MLNDVHVARISQICKTSMLVLFKLYEMERFSGIMFTPSFKKPSLLESLDPLMSYTERKKNRQTDRQT